MVELEALVAAGTSKSAAGSVLCRLCLQHDQSVADIFEELPQAEVQGDQTMIEKKPLVEWLFDLLQIKYEKSPILPSSICQRCLRMVQAFKNFRENVQNCESELQRWLLSNHKSGATQVDGQRPGLNGNPGVFELEEDSLVTEVDPEQDYESSEDDFSMESDSEIEDASTPPPPPFASAPLAATSLTQQSAEMSATPAKPVENVPPPPSAEECSADVSMPASELGAFAPSTSLSDSVDLVAKNTYLCQYCDMAFTTQMDCAEHESRHDSTAPYVCSFCSQRTSSRPNLIYHIKELHDPERPYICALCNKGFCRRSDLKKHTIVHTGVRPFTCPVCAKSFSRNTNLTKHMRIHSSVKPHVCQRCPRSFSSSAELIRHARSHTETKPFQCGRCSASFTRKDKLQLHEQAHYRRDAEFLINQAKVTSVSAVPTGSAVSTGLDQLHTPTGAASGGTQMENIVVALNPYGDHEPVAQHFAASGPAASLPSESMQRRQSILAAQLQQRAVGPKSSASKQPHARLFTCNICAKTFTRERDLQRHQALHLDSLFMCKQCGTGFNRREKLARHEQEYHAPQYPCDICRITFPKRDALEVHLKMHELQQNVAMATQAAINAASGTASAGGGTFSANVISGAAPLAVQPPLPKDVPTPHRPSASDMSFYSQLVPTMNLGFYSETRPEDRNGI